jgi:hypothetical protein
MSSVSNSLDYRHIIYGELLFTNNLSILSSIILQDYLAVLVNYSYDISKFCPISDSSSNNVNDQYYYCNIEDIQINYVMLTVESYSLLIELLKDSLIRGCIHIVGSSLPKLLSIYMIVY